MEREKWVGYIKEYDGGTIMECHLSAGPPHSSTFLNNLSRLLTLTDWRHPAYPTKSAYVDFEVDCVLRPQVWAQVSYTDFPVMIRQQRAAVDAKVRELSNSHIVYPGLAQFKTPAGPGGVRKPVSIQHIKGVKEAGWEPPGPPRYRLAGGSFRTNPLDPR